MSIETRDRVNNITKLYAEEEEREKEMKSAKLKYELCERAYVAIRNKVDVAELELEGSQGIG